ncbi:MAG: stage 0 sporulation protein [Firmicutes bacterium]|nr:stage 0 sporulation protein [Bacillota bacterium]
MTKVVNIRIGDNNPPVKYDTKIDLAPEDFVVVESPNGAEWGVVDTNPYEQKTSGQNYLVIRKADDNDMKTIKLRQNDAKNAVKVATDRIEKYKLDMKLLNATYTFDGGKVIIQFSSPGRVDFRELVKDLAYSLKTRIELKQVGSRDEVKTFGALGGCGQVCCCVRFKQDFENITIKMAKTQGLSLNPQKINGMCGRLLCCLNYENAHYIETAERMPKYGQEVQTPDGKGIAQGHNAIKETVDVKFHKDGVFRTECFRACDVKCGGCRKHEENI